MELTARDSSILDPIGIVWGEGIFLVGGCFLCSHAGQVSVFVTAAALSCNKNMT